VFTGLIEELGHVVSLHGPRLIVGARKVLEDAAVGASIAVNGVCVTLVDRRVGELGFDLGPETLGRTTLGDLAPGDAVNLERPLRLGGPMGGHLVQGHVDGVGLVADMTREGETGRLRIEWQDPALGGLLIPQGSVAVDGVSLTVASLGDRSFEIMVIPHTMAVTTLGRLKAGQRVNLEMDIIGKYVQRILSLRGDRS
jgi:riboflavin synthase